MSKGYVYILSNPSMPGLLKIGKTTRSVNQRADELFQTGVPSPFKVEHEVLAPDCHELESAVHHDLMDFRVSPSREFFNYDTTDAVSYLKHRLYEQVHQWMEEFLPCHVIVDELVHVCEADILFLADKCDAGPIDIAMAIGSMEPEEIKPALARYYKRIEAQSAKSFPFGDAETEGADVIQ